jgi:hypothetical protein
MCTQITLVCAQQLRNLGAVLPGAGLFVVADAALVIDVEDGMFGFKDS